jgi:hypothetical protein
MVEMFRINNNIDKVNSNKIFPKNENTTRGHKHTIYKKQCRTNIRKYSFSQRVVDTWNSLPAKVIESNTVNGFKNQLNSHWKDLETKSRQIYTNRKWHMDMTNQEGSQGLNLWPLHQMKTDEMFTTWFPPLYITKMAGGILPGITFIGTFIVKARDLTATSLNNH